MADDLREQYEGMGTLVTTALRKRPSLTSETDPADDSVGTAERGPMRDRNRIPIERRQE